MINPHESIFPKLIQLWNTAPEGLEYYNYLAKLWTKKPQADEILVIIQEWIIATGYPEYLNGE